MQKKVLITATVLSHIVSFHKPLADMLHEHGYEVHVAARNNLSEKNGMSLDFADKVFDIPFARSPLKFSNIKAYRELKRIIDNTDYEIIHCNTPVGGVLTRLAARSARKKGTKVFYTAHGFHFYKGAPLKNWLLYYPVEKALAKHTYALITICDEDYRLAKNKRFRTNICRIHSVGCDLDRFRPCPAEKPSNLREAKGFNEDDMIALCVGELNDNKNQITILKALPQIVADVPNFRLLLAGNGPNYEMLLKIIHQLNMDDHAQLIGYRSDILDYYLLCDMVVSASRREGLPMNIIEAMACAKPVVASCNRGHNELVDNGVTGLLVSANNADEFAAAIISLSNNPDLRQNLGLAGREKAYWYSTQVVKSELENIYFHQVLTDKRGLY